MSRWTSLEEQAHAWDLEECPLTVHIAGTPYPCAVDLTPITPEWDQRTGTTRMVQRAHIRVARTSLPTAPSAGAEILLQDHAWTVETLGERHPASIVWAITARRTA